MMMVRLDEMMSVMLEEETKGGETRMRLSLVMEKEIEPIFLIK